MAEEFKNLLGIDYGSAKIGLAYASSQTKLAVPLSIINLKDYSEKIAEVISDYQIDAMIIGWPSQKYATTNQVKIKNFAKELETKFKLPIFFEDERLTTQGASRYKSNGQDDAVAAALILQSFIDRRL